MTWFLIRLLERDPPITAAAVSSLYFTEHQSVDGWDRTPGLVLLLKDEALVDIIEVGKGLFDLLK